MRLVLFTEQSLCRVCLELLCERFAASATVLSAANIGEVEAHVSSSIPVDVVLYSEICPQSARLESIETLCRSIGSVPIVVHTRADDAKYLETARSLGIRGVISTSANPELAMAALSLVAAGGTYFPAPDGSTQAQSGTSDGNSSVLSGRQREVLRLIREGKTNRAIAKELGISEHTVKVHVRRIMRLLGVNSRIKVALSAASHLQA